MTEEALPELAEGERHYTTDLNNKLQTEEALLDTGEVVIAAPWWTPMFVIDTIKEGESYLGKGRRHV
jgi:hypothetical protein